MTELEKLLSEGEGLRPCPFCNKDPITPNVGRLACKDCFIYANQSTWQSRPREEKLAAVCRELRKAMEGLLMAMPSYGEAACFHNVLNKALARAEEIAEKLDSEELVEEVPFEEVLIAHTATRLAKPFPDKEKE